MHRWSINLKSNETHSISLLISLYVMHNAMHSPVCSSVFVSTYLFQATRQQPNNSWTLQYMNPGSSSTHRHIVLFANLVLTWVQSEALSIVCLNPNFLCFLVPQVNFPPVISVCLPHSAPHQSAFLTTVQPSPPAPLHPPLRPCTPDLHLSQTKTTCSLRVCRCCSERGGAERQNHGWY